MKIVVIGGTGLIGSKAVIKLREHGHEAVAASPNSGVNTLTAQAGMGEANIVVTYLREASSRRLTSQAGSRIRTRRRFLGATPLQAIALLHTWTLVTAASSGIGKEFARQIGASGN